MKRLASFLSITIGLVCLSFSSISSQPSHLKSFAQETNPFTPTPFPPLKLEVVTPSNIDNLMTVAHLTEFEGDAVADLAFSPDNRFLAGVSYYDQTMRIWDLQTGVNVATVLPITWSVDEIYPINLDYSPDGQKIAVGVSNNVYLFSVFHLTNVPTTLEPEKTISVGTSPIVNITFLYHPSLLAYQNIDGEVWLLDLETNSKRLILSTDPIYYSNLAFSSNGKLFIANNRLYDFDSGLEVSVLDKSCMALTFSPRNEILAACKVAESNPKEPQLWQISAQNQVHLVQRYEMSWFGGAIAFSPDGQILVIDDEYWETYTGDHLIDTPGGPSGVSCLGFSPDGTFLAIGRAGAGLAQLDGMYLMGVSASE